MKAVFRIEYRTQWGQELCLVSGERRMAMTYTPGDVWELEVDDCSAAMLSDYHYIVMRGDVVERSEWDHHSRKAPRACKGTLVCRDAWIDIPADSNGFLHRLSAPLFERKGFRAAGTAVPVFALRSRDGLGTGEFLDLKKLVDWAVLTGQNIIQLLPINDTTMSGTWQDSYPYNACTSFALHPQYLNLQEAGVRADARFKKLQRELNALPSVDYERVNSAKSMLMHELFAREGANVLESAAYKAFYQANRDWLLPYAVFCALRDEHGTAEFAQWGRYSNYSDAKARAYRKAHPQEVDYHCFVQYHLDRQLMQVREYAHAHDVYLKGDLPIGVSRTSADAWCFPQLFNLDSQAGAPPDFFSVDGQNWGFPTYNWEAMAQDNYLWWRRRLRKMAQYFDAFRIDHILGWFRIWEIPVPEKSGIKGHFSPAMPLHSDEIARMGLPLDGLFVPDPRQPEHWHPMISGKGSPVYQALQEHQKRCYDGLHDDFFFRRHNEYWRHEAMKKLPALLGCTGMLACGEDLGMIPDCVPEVMAEQKILSLEIQRMPKVFGQWFGRPQTYPYLCVCSTSSHDISPLRAWWEESSEARNKFWHDMLGKGGEAPQTCTTEIIESIIDSHLQSPAMLTILPLQDWTALEERLWYAGSPQDERVNDPANPRHYWKYRSHLLLEDLIGDEVLNSKIRNMTERSGRGR